MELPAKIRLILAENPRLTQAELGRLSGAGKSRVNQWLSGKIKTMSPEFAMNIWRELGYSAWWLTLDREPIRAPMPADTAASIAPIDVGAIVRVDWPLPGVDERKLRALSPSQLKTLAGRLLIEADDLGIDIRKRQAA